MGGQDRVRRQRERIQGKFLKVGKTGVDLKVAGKKNHGRVENIYK